MSLSLKIFVLIEHRDGEILKPSLETLGEALDLADTAGESSAEVIALLPVAQPSARLTDELASYGASRITQVRHPALAHFDAALWTEAVIQTMQSPGLNPVSDPSFIVHRSSFIVLAATPNGRELAPRLAVKLNGGLVADSVRVRLETMAGKSELEATVPLYGDRVYSQQRLAASNAVISFRPGARGMDRPGERGLVTPEIIEFNPDLSRLPKSLEHLGFVPADPRTVPLSEADKIVCGGAGVGQERFDLMWKLADLLGAAVGGTRVAVDKGWLEWDRQIGQTGQVVAPRLFLSCGTSGASQHVTGMKDSHTVIVINQDRNAPMFSLADLGVVGDVHQIVPPLLEKLQKLQSNQPETSPEKEKVLNL